MKLRIKGNAIRMRLTKTEIAQIAEGHAVRETLSFGNGGPEFVYTLEPSSEAQDLCARFDAANLRVLVPVAQAKEWALSDEVAIKADATETKPSLLVEKDFQCLKPRMHENEDESDLYYNPNELHGSCR